MYAMSCFVRPACPARRLRRKSIDYATPLKMPYEVTPNPALRAGRRPELPSMPVRNRTQIFGLRHREPTQSLAVSKLRGVEGAHGSDRSEEDWTSLAKVP